MSSCDSLIDAQQILEGCGGGGEIWSYDNIGGRVSFKVIYPESSGNISVEEQRNEMLSSPFVKNPKRLNFGALTEEELDLWRQ